MSSHFFLFRGHLGKVVINGLFTQENHVFNYKRPVKAVALEPDYAKSTSKQFVSGGMAGQLILNEKGTSIEPQPYDSPSTFVGDLEKGKNYFSDSSFLYVQAGLVTEMLSCTRERDPSTLSSGAVTSLLGRTIW